MSVSHSRRSLVRKRNSRYPIQLPKGGQSPLSLTIPQPVQLHIVRACKRLHLLETPNLHVCVETIAIAPVFLPSVRYSDINSHESTRLVPLNCFCLRHNLPRASDKAGLGSVPGCLHLLRKACYIWLCFAWLWTSSFGERIRWLAGPELFMVRQSISSWTMLISSWRHS